MAENRTRLWVGSKRGRALNGHDMEYNIWAWSDNPDRTWTTSYDAVCVDTCLACAGGDIKPDW